MTLPEVRRLLLARTEPLDRQRLCLHWSRFRRAHQAVAKQSHLTRRALRAPAVTASAATQGQEAAEGTGLHPLASTLEQPERVSAPVLRLAGTTPLTEDRWRALAALFPPLQVAPKRRRYDHRRILEGMLWVMQTGHAWRDVPVSFGPWHVVYDRYRTWRTRGIWEAVLCVLHPDAGEAPFVT